MMELKAIKKKYPKIVEQMRMAAIVAGVEILKIYLQSDFRIEYKSDDSPLTQADRIADKVICEMLMSSFPNIPIVSEESHGDLNAAMEEIFFLVDPLDGTKEFIKKTGEFTVNIALILNGKAEMGVVFVPVKGDLYYRGLDGLSFWERNASISGVKTDVELISCRPISPKNLTIVQSLSHSTPDTDAYVAKYEPTKSQSAGSSLKFCLIKFCLSLLARFLRALFCLCSSSQICEI